MGTWTADQIVTAITTGKRPDGRVLADIMPWRNLSHLAAADARAIVAYLKSVPAISHKVPGPFAASEKPPLPVFAIH